MKKLSTIIIILSLVFAGCGKKEEPAAETAAMPEAPAEESVEKSQTASETADSLMASGAETAEKAVADVKQAGDSMVKETMDKAATKAADMDFSNFSWDQVSKVAFADKLNLASWATKQAESWKGKLTDAASGQGLNMLSKMGDTGWQGSLKKVMDSINAVRESSPESFEAAKNALASAWTSFEKQASQFLEK